MDKTIEAYNAHAASWTAARVGGSFWEPERQHLKEYLPPGSRLIEFGCGPGWDGVELSRDYNYTGLDGSSAMLTLAAKRMPDTPLWLQNLYDLNLPEGEDLFDGFWCAAVLLHIPKKDIISVLSGMKKMLRPAAAGFISVKTGSGEDEVSRPDCPAPRHFSYWAGEEFSVTLRDAGYSVLEYRFRAADKNDWHEFFVAC
jgi:ubiquinone/menaquinone biosynthesis C-methylase UbiE